MAANLKIKGYKKSKNTKSKNKNLQIAQRRHMTDGDKEMLRDHVKSIQDPAAKEREIKRINKTYRQYGFFIQGA